MSAELAKENLVLISMSVQGVGRELFFAKQPPYPLSGVKIRTAGPMMSWVVQQVGGTPVQMDFAEVYESAQRGIVDGVDSTNVSNITMKFPEVMKYGYNQMFGQTTWMIVANKDAFNKLPKDWQDKMLALGPEAAKMMAKGAMDGDKGAKEEESSKYGMKFIDLAKEGQDKILAASTQRQAEWAQKSGPVGTKLQQIIKDYVTANPPK